MKCYPSVWIAAAALLLSGCMSRPMLSVESDRSPGVPQLRFADARTDAPVVVVDGLPWQMSDCTLDVYRLPQRAEVRHVMFRENRKLSETPTQEELSFDRVPERLAPHQTERTWLHGIAAGKYVAELKLRGQVVQSVDFEVRADPRAADTASGPGRWTGERGTLQIAEQHTTTFVSGSDVPAWAVRQADLMKKTRDDLNAQIESSPALIARLGKIQSVSPLGGSSSTTRRDKDGQIASMHGSYRCEVHGALRTEILVVDWERDSDAVPVKIVRILGENGAVALNLE